MPGFERRIIFYYSMRDNFGTFAGRNVLSVSRKNNLGHQASHSTQIKLIQKNCPPTRCVMRLENIEPGSAGPSCASARRIAANPAFVEKQAEVFPKIAVVLFDFAQRPGNIAAD